MGDVAQSVSAEPNTLGNAWMDSVLVRQDAGSILPQPISLKVARILHQVGSHCLGRLTARF